MASRLKERGGGGGKVMALPPPQRSALDGTPTVKTMARKSPGRTPRLKERGGGGGKVMALQPPQKSALEGTPTVKISARKSPGRTPIVGKENARSVSRGKVAPGVEKMPVIPAGMRWSTSSVSRGKSSTDSEISRLIAEFRSRGSGTSNLEEKDKILPRQSNNPDPHGRRSPAIRHAASKSVNSRDDISATSGSHLRRSVSRLRGSNLDKVGDKTLEISDQRRKSGFFPKKREEFVVLECYSKGSTTVISGLESCRRSSDVSVIAGESKRSSQIFPDSTEGEETGGHGNTVILQSKRSHEIPAKENEGFAKMTSKGPSKREEATGKSDVKVVAVADSVAFVPQKKVDLKVSNNAKVTTVVSDCSLKLQEKLAYLEGKVLKIASDIKRTKDMIESNVPRQSKLLLSDIQSKISGIEEAVSLVIDGVDAVSSSSSSLPAKPESSQSDLDKNFTAPKKPTKDFNPDELEARFFPHHKLLKNRTSTVSSKENSQPLSLVDENAIALEFLASLEVDKLNCNTRRRNASLDSITVQETGSGATSSLDNQSNLVDTGDNSQYTTLESTLAANETLEDFDDQENKPVIIPSEETEDSAVDQLFEIGSKCSTGGWFVSEGEAALLAHNDGSCSYFDITNNEIKTQYNPPVDISTNLWGDCWLIRAPGPDGCSGRYVVAASAGNSLGSGYCSWDFYTREARAFKIEEEAASSSLARGSSFGGQQWWYRPCGPLLVSVSSGLATAQCYDIRDGERVLSWALDSCAASMEFSSPLQWRSSGKLVIAETDAIRIWDVNSLSPQSLLSVGSGQRVNALHVNNTDSELGGGVRQRISSSEVEGNDGAFSTVDEVNVIDLRVPSGVGLRMQKKSTIGGESIFSRGDSIYLGGAEATSSGGGQRTTSIVKEFSLRKGKLRAAYQMPKVNAHPHHAPLTQVWGSADLVMGVSGMGLFVFSAAAGDGESGGVADVFGPDDLCSPSFDHVGSRVLLISRDRPAMWRYIY
ncbi:transducin/WD40 repeat-like superfamily protein [Wolffia australiana]